LFTIIGLSDTWWRKIDVISKVGTLHFHLMGEYSKLDRVKTMGTRWKINAVWWNIKINLQKIGRYMWMWIANKFEKFHAKRLTKIKMLLNVLGGYFFLKHTVVLVLTHWYLSSADTNSNQKQENACSKHTSSRTWSALEVNRAIFWQTDPQRDMTTICCSNNIHPPVLTTSG